MKKALVIALSVLMLLAFAACNIAASEPAAKADVTTIKAADVFDQHGFGIAKCTESGNYRFWAENSDGVEWTVFVLDEEFEDGLRYINQAYEASLVGDGNLELQKGQFIYVQCSANDLTGVEAPEGAAFNFCLDK